MNLPPLFYTETVTRTVHHLNSPYHEISIVTSIIVVLAVIYGFSIGALPRAGGRP